MLWLILLLVVVAIYLVANLLEEVESDYIDEEWP